MAENLHTKEDLRQRQSLPLEAKISMTQLRIRQWHNYWCGDVCVSFSGGKDSTVLLHLVRQMYPDVKAIFVNTGLEYPEIQQFVRTFDNVDIVRPEMRFDEVISKYGYPLISKEVAEAIYYARRIRSQTSNVERERERETKARFIDTSGSKSRRTLLHGQWVEADRQTDRQTDSGTNVRNVPSTKQTTTTAYKRDELENKRTQNDTKCRGGGTGFNRRTGSTIRKERDGDTNSTDSKPG